MTRVEDVRSRPGAIRVLLGGGPIRSGQSAEAQRIAEQRGRSPLQVLLDTVWSTATTSSTRPRPRRGLDYVELGDY